VESYLANPSLQPNFAQLNDCYQDAPANQYYWMDSVEALRELVIDTLFVFNLSELACVFERYFHFREDDFWDLVYDRLQHYAQQGHCSQARLDQMPINQDQIFTESLIKKKLADTEADLFHHKVSNPFANKPPLTSIESNR
jgi:siderophore synthetase component